VSIALQIDLNFSGPGVMASARPATGRKVLGSNPRVRSQPVAAVQIHMGLMNGDDEKPFLQFSDDEMLNPRYTILVYHYLFGQYRIKLTDREIPDSAAPAGHGSIVQELCTYRSPKLSEVVAHLRYAKDPLEVARSWATSENCERGRIRLDQSTEAAAK